ncbi:MAG: phosphate ABC transporter substrate-binding protein PstS [Thermoleophilaceae bacterium]|nr:phosphate ABC transporter substrate-binding protein PstS [Thermoleophilaceae bacterium]
MKFNEKLTFSGASAVLMVGLVLAAGAGTASAAVTPPITGSGSTLIAPLINQWNASLGGGITYGGGGSGKGVTDISNGVTDFGASDAPLIGDQIGKCAGCLTIPIALTAVTVVYNVPGIGNGLKLTPKLINLIYIGNINKWNDGRIAKINKGLSLPDLPITTIHRSDGSGSTYAFTDFLVRSKSGWQSKGTLVSWPLGLAVPGSGGVANALKTPGTIGYVGVDYAIPNKLTVAALQNSAGKFVLPSQKGIRAGAAWVKKVPKSGIVHFCAPPKTEKAAYPADTPSYIITRKGANSAGVRTMVNYALGKGLGISQDIGFAPLPKPVVAAGKATAKKL